MWGTLCDVDDRTADVNKKNPIVNVLYTTQAIISNNAVVKLEGFPEDFHSILQQKSVKSVILLYY